MFLGSDFSQYSSDSVENLIHSDVRHACTGAEGTMFFLARNACEALDYDLVSPAHRPGAMGVG